MALFKCKMCGGDLNITADEKIIECEFCGTTQTIPTSKDENLQGLFNRANILRMKSEFDKAEQLYEKIIEKDDTQAEAYWGFILCKYGIEYVEDPTTFKRIPTCHRTSYDSIIADEDYKSALAHADSVQRGIYEAEAKEIDRIQKGILELSQKEEPYDVFICYKETDNDGKRTKDSVIANDIYHQLTQEGLKVFYAAITLENKLGSAYEPCIFAALNSAKVMLAIGTKPEHFNAVWVKNEWSRFLKIIQKDRSKLLIPCYRDMDAYELPEEFAHLQAQDMSKIGFINDIVRGIKKVATPEESKQTVVKETVTVGANSNTAPLLERVFMFLEDGDWDFANEYCEKVLDIEPKCAEAYLGKLMAELHIKKQDALRNIEKPFNDNNNYQKAIRFGSEKLKNELEGYISYIKERNEDARKDGIYYDAKAAMNENTIDGCNKAIRLFKTISSHKDSGSLITECEAKIEDIKNQAEIDSKNSVYKKGIHLMETRTMSSYKSALSCFGSIPDWKDSSDKIIECKRVIKELEAEMEQRLKEKKAKEEQERLEREKQAEEEKVRKEQERIEKEKQEQAEREEIARIAKRNKKIAIIGAVVLIVGVIAAFLINQFIVIPAQEKKVQEAQIKAHETHVRATELMNTGNETEAIKLFSELNNEESSLALRKYFSKKSVLAIAPYTTSGLKLDGTVILAGQLGYGKDDYTTLWKDIVAIEEENDFTLGLKADGTVAVTQTISNPDPETYHGECDVEAWTDIVAISANYAHSVGLKSDGTVVTTKYTGEQKYYNGQCEVSDWTDIIAISAGTYHTVGLKSDGTVVSTKYTGDGAVTYRGQDKVSSWTDIVAISAGSYYTYGLKSNGTVVVTPNNGNKYYNQYGECDVSGWTDIVAISAADNHVLGLKKDGTVVSTKIDYEKADKGQTAVSEWTDIIAICAGNKRSVGLKSDGSVISTEYIGEEKDYRGECDVQGWNLFK